MFYPLSYVNCTVNNHVTHVLEDKIPFGLLFSYFDVLYVVLFSVKMNFKMISDVSYQVTDMRHINCSVTVVDDRNMTQ